MHDFDSKWPPVHNSFTYYLYLRTNLRIYTNLEIATHNSVLPDILFSVTQQWMKFGELKTLYRPVGCGPVFAETANRADSGQLQFWSQPSEILNLRSSNNPRNCKFRAYLIPKMSKKILNRLMSTQQLDVKILFRR